MNIQETLFRSYLEEGEEIIYTIRTHPKLFLRQLSVNALVYLVPSIWLLIYVEKFSIIWKIAVTIGLFKLFAEISLYYFNCFMATNLSFLHLNFKGFFNHSISRIEYNQVEGMDYEIKGLLNTLINNGSIHIEKLSGNVESITNVYKAKAKVKKLTKIHEGLHSQQLHKQHSNLKEILTDLLQNHITENGITITKD